MTKTTTAHVSPKLPIKVATPLRRTYYKQELSVSVKFVILPLMAKNRMKIKQVRVDIPVGEFLPHYPLI